MPVYRKLTLITYARMPNERTKNGNELSIRTEEKKIARAKKEKRTDLPEEKLSAWIMWSKCIITLWVAVSIYHVNNIHINRYMCTRHARSELLCANVWARGFEHSQHTKWMCVLARVVVLGTLKMNAEANSSLQHMSQWKKTAQICAHTKRKKAASLFFTWRMAFVFFMLVHFLPAIVEFHIRSMRIIIEHPLNWFQLSLGVCHLTWEHVFSGWEQQCHSNNGWM